MENLRRIRRRSILSTVGLLLVLIAGAGPAFGAPSSVLDDPVLVARLNRGLDHLYDMELPGALLVFDELTRDLPGHPIGPLLQAEVVWWEIQTDPLDTGPDERFLARIEEALGLAEDRLQGHPRDIDARFALAAGHALRGRYRSLRKEWLAAARDGRKALRWIRELHDRRPHDPDLNLGLGLYDYLSEAAPERYPVLEILEPFFPEGDRERGLRTLHRTRRAGRISRVPAALFLLKIEYYFETRYRESLDQVEWLRDRYPRNSVFHLYEGRIHSRWRQCSRADEVFREVLARSSAGWYGYGEYAREVALFHRARCALLDGRLEESLTQLARLERLAIRRESDFRSTVHLRRGMVFDAQGRRSEARTQYRAALQLPDMGTTHERARRHLREPWSP
ncbi:MAG: hypothetical protein R3234_03695 [Thermoanaerobaculia bacterium]|nr:hypothetical protein [Thermoanaerobaculia bacterium]